MSTSIKYYSTIQEISAIINASYVKGTQIMCVLKKIVNSYVKIEFYIAIFPQGKIRFREWGNRIKELL